MTARPLQTKEAMTLMETWIKKIKKANQNEGLCSFIFKYEGEYYLTEFVRGKHWSDPIKIKLL